MEKLDFNENQSVFRVGESSDKMFLLVKGKVGIFLPKNETKDADFFVEDNDLFGEMGIIDNELRSASARCVTQRTIIAITKKEFEIVGVAKAGHPFKKKILPHQAIEIYTGAIMPEGVDTIIMHEKCKRFDDNVIVNEKVKQNQNMRPIGENLKKGEVV